MGYLIWDLICFSVVPFSIDRSFSLLYNFLGGRRVVPLNEAVLEEEKL